MQPDAMEGSGSLSGPRDTTTGSEFKMVFALELQIWKAQCVLTSGLQGFHAGGHLRALVCTSSS